jgi:phosphoglycerol transferase MdoB-like AlkP superfamily enzyme
VKQSSSVSRYRFAIWLSFLFIVTNTISRIVLTVMAVQKNSLSPIDLGYSFFSGFLYDLATLSYVLIPILLWLTLFPLRWRNNNVWKISGWIFSLVAAYALVILAVSEWVFWAEFESRFNFIAVDYLVYTNEVIGNIRESYPLLTWLSLCVVASLILVIAISRLPFLNRWGHIPCKQALLALIIVQLLVNLAITGQTKDLRENRYSNELAGSGLYSLFYAFNNNELNYRHFYQTEDDSSTNTVIRQQLATPDAHFITTSGNDVSREIKHIGAERHLNVVLISVESLSADYLGKFGNKQGLTPNLDQLADTGMLFTRLYATGNRTVRGLEALSLAVPPTPGQSIVRRPNNESLFSLASVFNNKGYDSSFLYGGYGTFDNMNYFFANNGYNVKDRLELKSNQITHENIWGVADEDLYNMALRDFDETSKQGKPFFAHIMTTSNHRPYSFPENRIDLPNGSREAAVKYTDWAIGNFIKQASQHSWYKDTVFVIVADHCASSAGKTDLPVERYHIPLLVWSPAHLPTQKIDRLMSQIDIAPTLLGLLNFTYISNFMGVDVFATPQGPQRAFIATYQGLGYLTSDRLVILRPRKQPEIQALETPEAKTTKTNAELVKEAIAWYQFSSDAFSQGRMKLKH